MVKNKLSIDKVILILIILFSTGTVVGMIAYSLNLQKTPPIAIQPTTEPTVTPITTPIIDTSDWKTYKSEEFSIEFNYSPELFITEENQKIIVDSLAPNDPKQNSSIGIASKLEIALNTKNVQEIVNEYKTNNLNDFSIEQILINGLKATRITYTGAYGGETNYVILARNEIKSKTLIINYTDKKTFEPILFTFRFI